MLILDLRSKRIKNKSYLKVPPNPRKLDESFFSRNSVGEVAARDSGRSRDWRCKIESLSVEEFYKTRGLDELTKGVCICRGGLHIYTLLKGRWTELWVMPALEIKKRTQQWQQWRGSQWRGREMRKRWCPNGQGRKMFDEEKGDQSWQMLLRGK